jgi:hypothetical protein
MISLILNLFRRSRVQKNYRVVRMNEHHTRRRQILAKLTEKFRSKKHD